MNEKGHISKMKKGYSMFSFTEDADVAQKFHLIKAAGYDGAEPVMSEKGYLNHDSSEKEILSIKRMADTEELEIPSVGVWSLWENNLVSDSSIIRQKAEDIIKKQIEIAALLEADTILVVPGYVGCDFASNPERIRYDVAYDRCVDAFGRLALEAEKAKVQIGIENVWNRFLLSPLEMKRLLDTVDSDYVGTYFDVGNVIYTGYPEDWIRILGKRYIKKIHLSDYRRDQAGLGAFVDLLAGDVDFDEVSNALKEIGYQDYLTLEMLPNYKKYPDMSVWSGKYAVDLIAQMCEK